jgi:hypothetical protein
VSTVRIASWRCENDGPHVELREEGVGQSHLQRREGGPSRGVLTIPRLHSKKLLRRSWHSCGSSS